MVYIINFLAVILYYIFFRVCFPQYCNKLFAATVCVHAISFKALADPFNFVDTNSYVPAFKVIAHQSLQQVLMGDSRFIDWGYGFVLLNWLVSLFTKSPYMLYTVFALVGIPPVIWFYYKTSSALLFTILMFLAYPMLYRMGFGVVRQHLSIAYLLPALYYVHKPGKSLFFALIATSLHTSSALFFIYYAWRYFYGKMNVRETKIVYIIGTAVLLRVTYSTIALFFTHYAGYAEASGSNNFSPVLLLGLFVCFAFLNYHFLIFERRDQEMLDFLCFGFAMALGSMGTPLGRFTLMFMYVLCSAFTIFKKYSCGSMLKYSGWMAVLAAVVLWQLSNEKWNDYVSWILR